MLRVSFGDAVLQAPEATPYVEVALRLLEVYKAELEQGGSLSRKGASAPGNLHGRSRKIDIKQRLPEGRLPLDAAEAPQGRRGRWFVSLWPRIALPDGGFLAPRTVEELQEFIRSRGLTPHPRGDASMLLWQVRKRLGLSVNVGAGLESS